MPSLAHIIKSKSFVFLGACFLVFMAVIEIRQFREKSKVRQEIKNLTQQAEQIEQKNKDLTNFIAYLKTEGYKQRAAREQLNLKKEGELVYSIPLENKNVKYENSKGNNNQNESANYIKWWKYFFGINS